MDLLTLHRDVQRHDRFTGSVPGIHFDRTLECWVVMAPRDVRVMLQRAELAVPDYGAAYRELQERTEFSFENLLFAFRHVPLCTNGEEHEAARRRLAAFIGARQKAVARAVPDIVERRLAVLMPGRTVDIMAEVVDPLVSDLISTMTGTEITDHDAIRRASVIFDRMMGLRKRAAVDAELGRVRAMVRRGLPDAATEFDEGVRVALFVLGHDTLIGTLGESLHQILRVNAGRRLSEIRYPDYPPETGVAFGERVVVAPFSEGGVAFRAGDRIRIHFQGLCYSADPGDHARKFGAGVHACLGRRLSLDLWRRITDRLSRLDVRVEIRGVAMRDDDYIFTCPRELVVRVS